MFCVSINTRWRIEDGLRAAGCSVDVISYITSRILSDYFFCLWSQPHSGCHHVQFSRFPWSVSQKSDIRDVSKLHFTYLVYCSWYRQIELYFFRVQLSVHFNSEEWAKTYTNLSNWRKFTEEVFHTSTKVCNLRPLIAIIKWSARYSSMTCTYPIRSN